MYLGNFMFLETTVLLTKTIEEKTIYLLAVVLITYFRTKFKFLRCRSQAPGSSFANETRFAFRMAI